MPKKPVAKPIPFMLRLSPDLHAALQKKAVQDDRSMNGEIVHLLQLALERKIDPTT